MSTLAFRRPLRARARRPVLVSRNEMGFAVPGATVNEVRASSLALLAVALRSRVVRLSATWTTSITVHHGPAVGHATGWVMRRTSPDLAARAIAVNGLVWMAGAGCGLSVSLTA